MYDAARLRSTASKTTSLMNKYKGKRKSIKLTTGRSGASLGGTKNISRPRETNNLTIDS